MNNYPEYCYVDMHRINSKGIHEDWKRVPASKVDKYAQAMMAQQSQHIYSTIQKFSSPIHSEGEMYICPMYMDFDSDENLEDSINDAIKVMEHLIINHSIGDSIKIWFSGNRGIHITLDYGIFMAEPSNYLVKTWRHFAEYFIKELDLKTLDRNVYSKRRMWRVENTTHGKTGLYKVRLNPTELQLGVDAIRNLAKEPRGIHNGGNS